MTKEYDVVSATFNEWNLLKQKINKIEKPPFFTQKDIWWCSVGCNIGSEIYGKGVRFSRPVLVFKKLNHHSFLGIPLTTKVKDRYGYCLFSFKDKKICAVLGDMKKMDSRRLLGKMGRISEFNMKIIARGVNDMLF